LRRFEELFSLPLELPVGEGAFGVVPLRTGFGGSMNLDWGEAELEGFIGM